MTITTRLQAIKANIGQRRDTFQAAFDEAMAGRETTFGANPGNDFNFTVTPVKGDLHALLAKLGITQYGSKPHPRRFEVASTDITAIAAPLAGVRPRSANECIVI